MKKKVNKKAGFWVRLFSRIIDFLVFGIFSILIAYFNVSYKNKIEFLSNASFYIWSSISLFLAIFFFILIPFLTKGKTIGMFLFQIKIKFTDKKIFTSIIKREFLFSIVWIMNIFFMLTIINHTLINKFVSKQDLVVYSTWESFRIGIISSINAILFFIQWIFSFSIIIKKNKVGIHDMYSNTTTVWEKKYIYIKITKFNKIKSFKPFKISESKINWMEL